ncbi:MAG: anti-sigma factor family protein [Candidatus Eiseniibacteriota bacterium]
MNCHRARELASEAVDGTLPADLSTGFRAHLGACPPCRLFFAELKDSLALLSELPAVEVGDAFDEAVWAKLTAEQSRGVRRFWKDLWAAVDVGAWNRAWRLAPLGAAAAVLAVFALTGEPDYPALAGDPPSDEGSAAGEGAVLADLGPASAVDQVVAPLEETGEEVVGEMPEAIEVYLRNGARDLRLETTDRLRRANYSYPLRRVGEPGLIRVGTTTGYGAPSAGRPVSDAGATVISF